MAIGGQALIEGVMMLGKTSIATAVYLPSGNLIITNEPRIKSLKHPWLREFLVIRGFMNLVDMLVLGTKTLIYSANIAEDTGAKMSKKEVSLSLTLSLLMSAFLFIVLPAIAFKWLSHYIHSTMQLTLIEGIVRISILISFLSIMVLMKDMRRVYEYHGAEHKAVNCFEQNMPLTLENVRKCSRIHNRCGTSFLIIVMIVSVLIFSVIGQTSLHARIMLKLLLIPLVSGMSYEIIKYASKRCHLLFFKILLFPGLMVQRLTTREPDDKQMLAAIAALNEVL